MPLHAFLRFKGVNVKFGEYDTDVIISYTACIRFKEDTGKTKKEGKEKGLKDLKTLFYDEFKVVTTGSVKTRDDTLYLEILSHKLDMNGKYQEQAYPVHDYMSITENEYRELLSTFGFYLNKQKDCLNQHVLNNGNGVHLPMGTDEIKL
jgi:hypothetical protein